MTSSPQTKLQAPQYTVIFITEKQHLLVPVCEVHPFQTVAFYFQFAMFH